MSLEVEYSTVWVHLKIIFKSRKFISFKFKASNLRSNSKVSQFNLLNLVRVAGDELFSSSGISFYLSNRNVNFLEKT